MSGEPDPTRATGLFGGSFDPVHVGHLNLVRQLHELGRLEQTIFIPAAVPPHKQDRRVQPGEQRLAMLRRALVHEPRCFVSDYELRQGGLSYTIDTVTHFAKTYDDLWLVLGMDSLCDLHNWYRVDELLQRCRILTYARPGYPRPDRELLRQRFGGEKGDELAEGIVEAETCDVSSTEIREAVNRGIAPTELLPPGVWGYIQEHDLYRETL